MVCTANQCRSPMAEALLRQRLAERGVVASVRSAGLYRGGTAASAGSVRAMALRSLDLEGHRSRSVTPELVTGADLVLGMARLHVREVVLACPEVWPRCFTLKELVRRGEAQGPVAEGQSVGAWLAAAHDGRRRAEAVGDSPEDDVADPIGGPDALYEATAVELDHLATRLAALLGPARDVRP